MFPNPMTIIMRGKVYHLRLALSNELLLSEVQIMTLYIATGHLRKFPQCHANSRMVWEPVVALLKDPMERYQWMTR